MTEQQTLNNFPLVSVVTVSFNCREFLRKCLSSLVRQTYSNVEIIAVDNGSDEDLETALKVEFPSIKWLRLSSNSGFAGGNNTGILKARGKYVALINNDAQADENWLSCLVAAAEQDDKVGAVASMIIDGNNPAILDSCGVIVALDGMSRQAMHGIQSNTALQKQSVLAFSGCACLIRMSALEQTGLFDTRFFAYCEDTDLSLRILRAGWNIITAPEAKVSHSYSKTGGAFSLNKVFWIERNHYWVAIKNFPLPLLLLLPAVSMWRYIFQVYAALRGIGKIDAFVSTCGVTRLILTLLRSNLSAIAGLMPALASRFARQQGYARSSAEMRRLILSLHAPMQEIFSGNSPKRSAVTDIANRFSKESL